MVVFFSYNHGLMIGCPLSFEILDYDWIKAYFEFRRGLTSFLELLCLERQGGDCVDLVSVL